MFTAILPGVSLPPYVSTMSSFRHKNPFVGRPSGGEKLTPPPPLAKSWIRPCMALCVTASLDTESSKEEIKKPDCALLSVGPFSLLSSRHINSTASERKIHGYGLEWDPVHGNLCLVLSRVYTTPWCIPSYLKNYVSGCMYDCIYVMLWNSQPKRSIQIKKQHLVCAISPCLTCPRA